MSVTKSSSRAELVKAFAVACAKMEGFYLTESEAKAQKVPWPTLAQRNNNPLNLRSWGSHAIRDAYVFFSPEIPRGATLPFTHAGWKAAFRQVERNIFERHLSFLQFFAGQRDVAGKLLPGGYPGFAPMQDSNKPREYAAFVLAELKTSWPPLARLTGQELDAITVDSIIERLA